MTSEQIKTFILGSPIKSTKWIRSFVFFHFEKGSNTFMLTWLGWIQTSLWTYSLSIESSLILKSPRNPQRQPKLLRHRTYWVPSFSKYPLIKTQCPLSILAPYLIGSSKWLDAIPKVGSLKVLWKVSNAIIVLGRFATSDMSLLSFCLTYF